MPTTFAGAAQAPEFAEPPLHLSGDADRYDHREGNDDHGQARALFRLFDGAQRQRLFSNIAVAMQGVPAAIVDRQLARFRTVDPAYADGVARALGR